MRIRSVFKMQIAKIKRLDPHAEKEKRRIRRRKRKWHMQKKPKKQHESWGKATWVTGLSANGWLFGGESNQKGEGKASLHVVNCKMRLGVGVVQPQIASSVIWPESGTI